MAFADFSSLCEKASVFAICEGCGAIDEWVDKRVTQDLWTLAERADFTAGRHVVEMRGRCAACRVLEIKTED